MTPHDIEHQSESFIGGWIIDDKICNALIEQHTNKPHKWINETSTIRGYTALTSRNLDEEIHQTYTKLISQCIKEYARKYEWVTKGSPFFMSALYNVQRYEPENNYKVWHCEDYGPTKGRLIRNLGFLTYLNDIEHDGETEFLYQNVSVKPKKGLTLIWPAGWTHPHRGLPTNEVKYITTGWCCYNHRP